MKKKRRVEIETREIENKFKAKCRTAQTLGKDADLKMKSMKKKLGLEDA